MLAFNYAVGGAMVQNVRSQVIDFSSQVGKKPKWAPWKAENSLFVIWVGVNDNGIGLDPETQLKHLFETQELLFKAGARNLVFFNVPPMDRSPAGIRQ